MARWRAARSSADRPEVSWLEPEAGRGAAGGAGRGSNRRFSADEGAARLPPPGTWVRARLVSTTTVLERPWLKLCFTVPALTDPAPRGLRVRGWRPPGAGGRPVLFPSLMRSLYTSARGPGPRLQ